MKSIFVVFTILLLINKLSAQDITTDSSFANMVVEALQTGELSSVSKLYPTENEYVIFKELTGVELPADFLERSRKEQNEWIERVFELARNYNIKLKKFKLEKYEFITKKIRNSSVMEVAGNIWLKRGKKWVTLTQISAMKIDSRYFLMEIRGLSPGKVMTYN